MKVSTLKKVIGLAVLAQLMLAPLVLHAEQEDVDNYNKAASNKNGSVDLYGY